MDFSVDRRNEISMSGEARTGRLLRWERRFPRNSKPAFVPRQEDGGEVETHRDVAHRSHEDGSCMFSYNSNQHITIIIT